MFYWYFTKIVSRWLHFLTLWKIQVNCNYPVSVWNFSWETFAQASGIDPTNMSHTIRRHETFTSEGDFCARLLRLRLLNWTTFIFSTYCLHETTISFSLIPSDTGRTGSTGLKGPPAPQRIKGQEGQMWVITAGDERTALEMLLWCTQVGRKSILCEWRII